MKINSIFSILLIICILIFSSHQKSWAQDKDSSNVSLEVTADLVSSYIWRGMLCDMKPNIQPNIALTISDFEIGLWGTSNFDNTYREVDYWLSYTYKDFSLTLNDYFWTPYFDSLKFFNWNNKTTGHTLEASLAWEGTESFPLKITAATFIYGADKKFDHFDEISKEPQYKNQYSSYFELAYPFKLKKTEVNTFLGITPAEGLYADGAGIVNLGFSAKKYIVMSDKYSLPLTASFITNPYEGTTYIVLGISL